ncbi:MAG TPA: hypothetical protein VH134_17020 [Candidatus Dormibacteraeota bacterium]|nr:hypothetical protein [Candidatus Dormibacteraeota bacterium]
MIRVLAAALAAAGLLWSECVPVHASPVAPPGGADAAGLRVAPLDTCVSCTSASAAPDHTSARATALRLLGNDVAGGASQDGAARRGSLAALPSNAVLDLAVLSWDTGTETGGPPASQSRTALLDAGLLPAGEDSTTGGLITVAVLESFSDATHSGSRSGGYGAANGADIGLANGAVVIILLHSQATTDGHDNAYLVAVAGESAGGTAGDTPGTAVSVPGLLDLTLLRASATGASGGDAAVGSVDGLLGDSGQAAGALLSAAHGPAAPVAITPARPPATGAAAASANPAPGLAPPSTGTGLSAGGGLLLIVGLLAIRLSMRRPART